MRSCQGNNSLTLPRGKKRVSFGRLWACGKAPITSDEFFLFIFVVFLYLLLEKHFQWSYIFFSLFFWEWNLIWWDVSVLFLKSGLRILNVFYLPYKSNFYVVRDWKFKIPFDFENWVLFKSFGPRFGGGGEMQGKVRKKICEKIK